MLHAKAYAKINLGLEVLHKRQDGYHEINSVFHRISLSDEISIEHSTTLEVVCMALSHEAPENNLVYKAAQELQKAGGAREGAKITIDKHIPIGAGLGGGSSDAATTLSLLNSFWKLSLPPTTLHSIAAKLGSDVPFFLYNGSCVARGRGTDIQMVDLELPWHLLLLCPPLHISTAEAYSALHLPAQAREATDLVAALRQAKTNPQSLRSTLRNDFEQSVFEQRPALSFIKQRLYESGALYAQMSGSGSACFGLYHSADEAQRARLHFLELPSHVCSFIDAADSQ